MRIKKRYILLFVILGVLVTGLLIPQKLIIPVEGAGKHSYHPASFWYYPWGKSVTHKGVDLFAQSGTPVVAATNGLVLFSGNIPVGGEVALILGPKWRLHYYAHLQSRSVVSLQWRWKGQKIGFVGDTGNAKGKPPHLHYAIATLIPYPWRIDRSRQGWKKMFYLNPIHFFENE